MDASRLEVYLSKFASSHPSFLFAMAPKGVRELRKQQHIDDGVDDRAAKVQRVVHVGSTSHRALVEIMGGVNEGVSRAYTSDVAHARFATACTSLEMPTLDGGRLRWDMLKPDALVNRLASESPLLSDWLRAALAIHPCTAEQPWRLLVGWDEFVPGNKLAAQHSRKVMNLHFSFEELGPALSMDDAWFTPVAVRSRVIQEVQGSWSAMLKEFLKVLLFSPGGFQTREGAAVQLADGTVVVIYARISRLLSDGDGLRLAMQWKGAACTKPCWRHSNVFRKGSDLVQHFGDGRYVEVGCGDPSKFNCWSEADLREIVDYLSNAYQSVADGRMTKKRLEELQKCYGFAITPDGLLVDGSLRGAFNITEAFRYDWVHAFLANGLVTPDLWALVSKAETLRICSQSQLSEYLKDGWQTPRHSRRKGTRAKFHAV